MNIRYAQMREGWYNSGSKAWNFAGTSRSLMLHRSCWLTRQRAWMGVRRAHGWKCWAATVMAQYPVKVLDASSAVAAQEAGA